MVYIKRDFYSDFVSADGVSKSDMLINAIAKVVSDDRSEVVQLLNLVGNNVNVTDKSSNKAVSTAIINSLDDARFQNGIAYLIGKNNGLDFGAKTDSIAAISQGVGSFSQDDISRLTTVLNQSDKTKVISSSQPKTNKALYWLLGIALVVVVISKVSSKTNEGE